MGAIHVTTTIRNPKSYGTVFEADFLVGTGSTDSMAPASELRKIGIEPGGKMSYELADGSVHEYEFGLGEIEFLGNLTWGRVIFGPDGTEPILGVTVLESAGIVIDPANRTLRRLPAIPLKRAASAEH